jgi:hypothetical protein
MAFLSAAKGGGADFALYDFPRTQHIWRFVDAAYERSFSGKLKKTR